MTVASAAEPVICMPLRTPVGRFGGALKDVPAQTLAATVIREVVSRSGVQEDAIDDVIVGNASPSGEAPALGRVAALDAGLPVTVPGAQVDRRCGSGLYAVVLGITQIQAGCAELIVAGGAESMSQVEYYATGLRFGHPAADVQLRDRLARARVTAGGRRHPVEGGMIATAETLRREFAVSREEQDELALESHRRAVAATREGRFDAELVPVPVGKPGKEELFVRDEHPRADTTAEQLASLRPIMSRQDAQATVTAGNSSGQNDGAAFCIVASRRRAEQLGLEPVARIVSWALSGVEPGRMGIGPVPASELALKRAGLTLSDMDLIELNEAFAAQVLAVTKSWGLGAADMERVNVNGSGISLGHPVGATGARILATLTHEMSRREARYGLETMCIGGGQGIAAVVERLAA